MTDARSPSAPKSGDEYTGGLHEGFPCRPECSTGSWAETSSRCGGGSRHRRSTPTPLTPTASCRPHTPWTNGCHSEQAHLGTRFRHGELRRSRAAQYTRTPGPSRLWVTVGHHLLTRLITKDGARPCGTDPPWGVPVKTWACEGNVEQLSRPPRWVSLTASPRG